MSVALNLRASAMPLAFRCAASVRRSAIPIDETHEAGDVGTAVHAALRRLAERGSVDWDGLPELAAQYGANLDDVRALCAMATKLWPRVSASFGRSLTEVELEYTFAGFTLTGHMDLVSVSGDVARGGDWKSGRVDSDYSEQMKAYGTLILLNYPQLREVTVTIIWLRDGEIENYTLTRADAIAWAQRFEREVVQWDGVYKAGNHCKFCPRSHECEAANALVRRDVAAIADKSIVARAESELAVMAPDEIVSIYEKASLVEAYAKRVREAVKLHVLNHGDVVADGARLTIQREKRRQLNPLQAWPVLESVGFEDEDFASVMDLRVSRVEKRVREKAGKGNGAHAVRVLDAALRDAGAVEINEIEKLVQKRG